MTKKQLVKLQKDIFKLYERAKLTPKQIEIVQEIIDIELTIENACNK